MVILLECQHLFGPYTIDDEGFTAKILEYLQSIGDRIIQEKEKRTFTC